MLGEEEKETSLTSEAISKETNTGNNSGSEEKRYSGKKKEKPEEDETEEGELIDEFDEENAFGFGSASP